MVKVAKHKWFVSCILPGIRPLGLMQFESTANEMQDIAESLAPCRCEFQAYKIPEFEDNVPVGEFVDFETAKGAGILMVKTASELLRDWIDSKIKEAAESG